MFACSLCREKNGGRGDEKEEEGRRRREGEEREGREGRRRMKCVQWNPSTTDTFGTNISSVIARCPQLRGFWCISGRRGMCNPAVEYNVAAFSEFSFAARWQGRLSRG